MAEKKPAPKHVEKDEIDEPPFGGHEVHHARLAEITLNVTKVTDEDEPAGEIHLLAVHDLKVERVAQLALAGEERQRRRVLRLVDLLLEHLPGRDLQPCIPGLGNGLHAED